MSKKYLKFIFIACLPISLSACSAAGGDNLLKFRGLVLSKQVNIDTYIPSISTIEIDFRAGTVLYNGEITTKASVCSNDEWICIADNTLEFAIRRDWNGIEKTWVYRGVRYRVLDLNYGVQENKRDAVVYIAADFNKDGSLTNSSRVFGYSIKKGLVSIMIFSSPPGQVPIPAVFTRYD